MEESATCGTKFMFYPGIQPAKGLVLGVGVGVDEQEVYVLAPPIGF